MTLCGTGHGYDLSFTSMHMKAEPVAVADASLSPLVHLGAVEVAKQLNSTPVHVKVVRPPMRAGVGDARNLGQSSGIGPCGCPVGNG